MSPWHTTTGSAVGPVGLQPRGGSGEIGTAERVGGGAQRLEHRVQPRARDSRRVEAVLDRGRVEAVQLGEDRGERDREAAGERGKLRQRPDAVEAGEERVALGEGHDHEGPAVDAVGGSARGQHPWGGEVLVGDLGLEHRLLGGGRGVGHDPGDERPGPSGRGVGQAEGHQLGPEPAGQRNRITVIGQLQRRR